MSYENIIVAEQDEIGIITLNRPRAMNALNNKMIQELAKQLKKFDKDKTIGTMVITGNESCFAAGADVKEMYEKKFVNALLDDCITPWEDIERIRKPVIAAVSGYALGGGCELAMMCDFIIAADNAKFGQPEVNLGIAPGLGGTQRLTRIIGKSKAMEMCLTGRMMDAIQAEQCGLVSRVVPLDKLMDEVIETAGKISKMSVTATTSIKQAVNCAYQTSLDEGLRFERKSFCSLFATQDKEEGMKAFIEKREPNFNNQ